ncbi:TPA: helix-turn-helix domain-containing protein [Serratia marcescens]|uniref:winged helix-turn-helix domain-containing protein n=1 Tax=Serratia marcescens TaxID=615 RepID=UPI0018D4BDF0|nr:helix-turn-helix domain-containing protein [Serratia marcescens]MBH3114763.1 helix-turn-helix domain-containing protein [Serratia marcescens]MBH3152616.1 helix-turn-helix domain-containing protein [Serratia marcescens]MBH3166642.1 helix-turn-helix domain-containing protein [Serratia marcescens]HEJ6963207.1 helix-turn-helix domain-containing protein [Serratia marcescens]
MRFLINNRIIFDEDNSTLALAEENLEPVTLTTIANRLLALLVKNNGILISRDFIFSTVWDDHGKTASNSNLNNYIASLRRTFAGLGESEILVTVPRQGFMFTAASIHSVADNMTQDETVPAAPLPVRRHCDAILPKVTLLFIGIALVLAGVYFFTERYDTAYQTQIASYKSCRVETLNASERIDERYIADALERLKSRGFDCDVPATVYYSRLTYHYTNYKKLIDFISYCPKHRVKNMDAHCEDEFEVINEG